MTYLDGSEREMAKWAHQRLDTARRRNEDKQRAALTESLPSPGASVSRPQAVRSAARRSSSQSTRPTL